MTTTKPHFEVDRKGLAKILERKGKAFAMLELVQNALDEDVTKVAIELVAVPGRPLVEFGVEDDDPDGFTDLRHAYTLYAESEKKSDATKRGRFNLGEKLVIAIAKDLTIATTTGTIRFTDDGRHESRAKRQRGSRVSGFLPMTRAEFEETLAVLRTVLVPAGVKVTLNGEPLLVRRPLHTFEATLPTEVADDEGYLRSTRRQTTVSLYTVKGDETAHIYELGIPVVETDLPWHIDVAQKVPVNMDRDNVTPGYRKILVRHATDAMHDRLTPEQAASPWVDDALADPDLDDAAIESILTARFTEKRVIYDPSDPEANKLATSKGYTVMPGGMFNKQQWDNVRRSGTQAAGKVTPSPKPYSDDPNAPPVQVIDPSKYTEAQRLMVKYIEELHRRVMGKPVAIRIVNTSNGFAACYGPGVYPQAHGALDLNQKRLGKAWFELGPCARVNDLMIHEFGHFYCDDHLDDGYYRALTRIGAAMTQLAIDEPGFFRKHAKLFAHLREPAPV
jgi:hypothetical protein